MRLQLRKEIINMTSRVPGASKTNLNNSLTNLADLVVNQSTVNGKIDQGLVKQNMIDILSSFCPGNMMGKYVPPPQHAPVVNSFSSSGPVKAVQNNSSPPPKAAVHSQPPPPTKADQARSIAAKAAVKSKFGSMSHFGSCSDGFMMFMLLLLIVAGVLYYLHSQGKIQFPTMGQRIAQFGRDMRSIRGIRARR